MSGIAEIIKALSKEGKSPGAIAADLYDRGLKNAQGRFLTPPMVAGFLRHRETEKPPTVFPAGGDPPISVPKADQPETLPPKKSKELPLDLNYGGENSYPDVPPYNFTHRARYAGTYLPSASSAADAVGCD